MYNPVLLQKQLKENNSDLVDYCKELKKWGEEIKEKEKSLKTEKQELNSSQVEENAKKAETKKVKKSVKPKPEPEVKSKVPKTAEYWDKLKVDTSEEEDSELSDELDEDIIELANEQKEKGNKCVKNGDYVAAIVHYTEAISHHKYDPVYYANRALCYNKLKDFRNAEADCTTALQLDNDYVKALHRRASARESLGQLIEAKQDLQRILTLDPNNKESQNLLQKINKKIQPEDIYQKPVSKFTLSRQNKATPKASPSSAPYVSTPEIAVKQHVVERRKPTETSPKLNKTAVVSQKTSIGGTAAEKTSNKADSDISWPSGEDVEIVESVFKTPKERSQGRMKRVTVFAGEAGLSLKKGAEIKTATEPNKPMGVEQSKPTVKKVEVEKPCRNEGLKENKEISPNFEESILSKNQNFSSWTPAETTDFQVPIARTSIQFYQAWKTLSKPERKLYLMQINPIEFKNIFKDNLDNRVFSEMIQTLEADDASFECLYGLTRVNRFITMVMFASKEDTLRLQSLWTAMATSDKYSTDELKFLFKEKYKLKI